MYKRQSYFSVTRSSPPTANEGKQNATCTPAAKPLPAMRGNSMRHVEFRWVCCQIQPLFSQAKRASNWQHYSNPVSYTHLLCALMIAARQTKATQGKIAIISMQPLVREVFGIARFDLVIPCFNDLACAIEGLAP